LTLHFQKNSFFPMYSFPYDRFCTQDVLEVNPSLEKFKPIFFTVW